MKKIDHNVGFWEKRHFFRRKLAKIAENCDHNIDPSWSSYFTDVIIFEKFLQDSSDSGKTDDTLKVFPDSSDVVSLDLS
jgi:hypothetical protein